MYLPLLGPVNLPWFVLLHAFWLTFTGLSLLFSQPISSLLNSSSKNTTPTNASKQNPSTTSASQTKDDTSSTLLGLSSLGLGLGYLTTAYVEIESNQFLYGSVIVRIALGGLAGVKGLLDVLAKSKNRNYDGGKKTLLFVGAYDALGGLVLGYWLGEGGFSGRPPVY